METIIGKVKNYVFHNEENSYSIARITNESDEIITIVGYFPIVSEDIMYEFTGSWVKHNSYGDQFKIESFKKCEEQSASGLISYLSSSFFHGIGPKTAEKIVNHFGNDAIRIILSDKKVLKEVGLTAIRIEKFHQQLIENQTNEHILVALYGYNLSGKLAMKLLGKYQMLTLEKLEENPYRLIDDIEGIGFIKADEIASKLSIPKDDLRRIKAAIIYAMQYIAYQNGDVYLTKEQVENYAASVLGDGLDLSTAIDHLIEEKRIIIEEDRFYLSLSYFTEISLAEKVIELSESSAVIYDMNYLKTLLDAVEIQKNMQYTQVQKEAILKALSSPISIITGGPGTGKTTIIDGLLEVYRIYNKLNYKNPLIYEKIALMAPTGRAAKRMKELLDMDAKTIHRHLGYSYDGLFTYDENHLMPQDLIIIDEASMIDLFLAKKLFSAIKPGAQVIIVGDVDQLPSVGPGQVLADLIDSKVITTVRLKEIHRQAKDSKIISLARAVNDQDLSSEDLNSDQDVYLYRANADKIKEVIIKQVQGALNEGYSMIDDIQILAPMYKGDLGIDNFNKILQEEFNKNRSVSIKYGDKTYYVGDKVIQLVNDPERLIMNGDIGIVKDIKVNSQDEQYMVVTFDDNDVMYDKSDLDELNLAYAISIHKSQGSEYKIVMIPMVRSYMHMLKKELIYTAITRAKRFLILLGDMNLLVYAANHISEKRQTTLALRLNHTIDNEFESEDPLEELSPYDFM
ncbi:MAG: ATP-dependent RecD-like DNA helicase [Tenericutes bacterium HGW-Tenericutes-2]|jgi:exodeoxyribonuclease V alpha subunit|nr:MAG: ATP-dependent RecD-like DNA helicase [Tenericutes bacterium HGW-Tenericutes-2]